MTFTIEYLSDRVIVVYAEAEAVVVRVECLQ